MRDRDKSQICSSLEVLEGTDYLLRQPQSRASSIRELTNSICLAEVAADDTVRITALAQLQLQEINLNLIVLHKQPVLHHLHQGTQQHKAAILSTPLKYTVLNTVSLLESSHKLNTDLLLDSVTS